MEIFGWYFWKIISVPCARSMLWQGKCWARYLVTQLSCDGLSAPRLCQTSKNLPKIRLKNLWNWRVILVPATIWQVLNMKCMEWPETEAFWIYRNFVKSFHVNLFLAGFTHLRPMCSSVCWGCSCLGYWVCARANRWSHASAGQCTPVLVSRP